MSKLNSRHSVLNDGTKVAPLAEKDKWNQAIRDASALLLRVESRAARLRGAIKTFKDLRDLGADCSAPKSAEDI